MEIISCLLNPIQRVFGSEIPIVVTVIARDDSGKEVTACGFTVISTLDDTTLAAAFQRAKEMALTRLDVPDNSKVIKALIQPEVKSLVVTKTTEWKAQSKSDEYIEKALNAPVDETRIKQINEVCESLGIQPLDLGSYSLVEATCLKAALEEAAKVLE